MSTWAEYVARRVAGEIESALLVHGPFAGVHEAESVLREEFEEFWDQVKLKPSKREYQTMVDKLVQIAAMAQCYAAQLLEAREAIR